MTDFIKKEQVNGSQKVVVGNKYNDLVLRTLGRVYVQTGSKFTLLTEYLDKITNEKESNKILVWNNDSELTEGRYPGDGYFIYISETKDLYITFSGGYVPLILAGNSTLDWEALNKRFLSKSGGEVDNFIKINGGLIAENGKFYDQVEINGINAPLKVTSKELVKNFNAEYLQGYGPEDIPIKTRDESILGKWKFNNVTSFNDTVRYSGKLVNADGFAPGFTGYGWMLDSETCTLTVDNLIVRKLMNVYELVVNKISATNGSLWVSDSAKIKSAEIVDSTILMDDFGEPVLDDAGNIVYETHPLYDERENESFDKSALYPDNDSTFPHESIDQNKNKLINIYKSYFTGEFYHIALDEDYCPFRLNDLLRCQRFDGTNIKYYDAIVTNTLQSNEIIIRLSSLLNDTYNSVTEETDADGNITSSVNNKPQNQFEEVNGELIEVSTTTFDKSLTIPEEGDGLVRIGSSSVRERMGAVYITSSDVGGPYIDVMDEVLTPNFNKITKYNDPKRPNSVVHKCLKIRLGNLNGIYDPDFIQQPYGYGLYGENVFLKGKFMQVTSSGSTEPIPIYRGEWSPTKRYDKGDQVTDDGQIYSALRTNTNKQPSLYYEGEDVFWELSVAKGEDGKPGEPGKDGIGASPVFYGEYDPTTKYPVSKVVSSIVCVTSDNGNNKQYFKTKVQNGFGNKEFIQGIHPIKNGVIQEPWESFGGDFQSIATGLLLAEEANIAEFIFKDKKLISQKGYVMSNPYNFETIDSENFCTVNYKGVIEKSTTNQNYIRFSFAHLAATELFTSMMQASYDQWTNDEMNLSKIDLPFVSGFVLENIWFHPTDSSPTSILCYTRQGYSNKYYSVTRGNQGLIYKEITGIPSRNIISIQQDRSSNTCYLFFDNGVIYKKTGIMDSYFEQVAINPISVPSGEELKFVNFLTDYELNPLTAAIVYSSDVSIYIKIKNGNTILKFDYNSLPISLNNIFIRTTDKLKSRMDFCKFILSGVDSDNKLHNFVIQPRLDVVSGQNKYDFRILDTLYNVHDPITNVQLTRVIDPSLTNTYKNLLIRTFWSNDKCVKLEVTENGEYEAITQTPTKYIPGFINKDVFSMECISLIGNKIPSDLTTEVNKNLFVPNLELDGLSGKIRAIEGNIGNFQIHEDRLEANGIVMLNGPVPNVDNLSEELNIQSVNNPLMRPFDIMTTGLQNPTSVSYGYLDIYENSAITMKALFATDELVSYVINRRKSYVFGQPDINLSTKLYLFKVEILNKYNNVVFSSSSNVDYDISDEFGSLYANRLPPIDITLIPGRYVFKMTLEYRVSQISGPSVNGRTVTTELISSFPNLTISPNASAKTFIGTDGLLTYSGKQDYFKYNSLTGLLIKKGSTGFKIDETGIYISYQLSPNYPETWHKLKPQIS